MLNLKCALYLILGIGSLILSFKSQACIAPPDTADYYEANYVRNDNFTYKSNIKSIEIFKNGFELSDPLIELNSGENFHVSFDDLHPGVKQFYFTVFHCDANWNTSNLWPNEYLQNLSEDQIEDYSPSFGTRTPYTHYSFQFPNERLSITKSGNYILKVFTRNNNNVEDVIFTRRFLVVDPQVSINGSALQASTSEFFETHQEIDFTISTSGYRIDSPYQDIKVVVLQNWRWDNALTTLKPNMVRNDLLDYNFDNEINIMEGGNEFRYFDIKSLKFISDRIRSVSFDDTMNYVTLWDTQKRLYKTYSSEQDINGKFLLKTDDEHDVSTMGEYARVQFFLAYDAPIVEGNLYVAGNFNGWQFSTENKMKYNYKRKGYELSLLLKQGYYNYQYLLLPNNFSKGDIGFIEGNHGITQNSYTILVYHRKKNELYDELIGVRTFESGSK